MSAGLLVNKQSESGQWTETRYKKIIRFVYITPLFAKKKKFCNWLDKKYLKLCTRHNPEL